MATSHSRSSSSSFASSLGRWGSSSCTKKTNNILPSLLLLFFIMNFAALPHETHAAFPTISCASTLANVDPATPCGAPAPNYKTLISAMESTGSPYSLSTTIVLPSTSQEFYYRSSKKSALEFNENDQLAFQTAGGAVSPLAPTAEFKLLRIDGPTPTPQNDGCITELFNPSPSLVLEHLLFCSAKVHLDFPVPLNITSKFEATNSALFGTGVKGDGFQMPSSSIYLSSSSLLDFDISICIFYAEDTNATLLRLQTTAPFSGFPCEAVITDSNLTLTALLDTIIWEAPMDVENTVIKWGSTILIRASISNFYGSTFEGATLSVDQDAEVVFDSSLSLDCDDITVSSNAKVSILNSQTNRLLKTITLIDQSRMMLENSTVSILGSWSSFDDSFVSSWKSTITVQRSFAMLGSSVLNVAESTIFLLGDPATFILSSFAALDSSIVNVQNSNVFLSFGLFTGQDSGTFTFSSSMLHLALYGTFFFPPGSDMDVNFTNTSVAFEGGFIGVFGKTRFTVIQSLFVDITAVGDKSSSLIAGGSTLVSFSQSVIQFEGNFAAMIGSDDATFRVYSTILSFKSSGLNPVFLLNQTATFLASNSTIQLGGPLALYGSCFLHLTNESYAIAVQALSSSEISITLRDSARFKLTDSWFDYSGTLSLHPGTMFVAVRSIVRTPNGDNQLIEGLGGSMILQNSDFFLAGGLKFSLGSYLWASNSNLSIAGNRGCQFTDKANLNTESSKFFVSGLNGLNFGGSSSWVGTNTSLLLISRLGLLIGFKPTDKVTLTLTNSNLTVLADEFGFSAVIGGFSKVLMQGVHLSLLRGQIMFFGDSVLTSKESLVDITSSFVFPSILTLAGSHHSIFQSSYFTLLNGDLILVNSSVLTLQTSQLSILFSGFLYLTGSSRVETSSSLIVIPEGNLIAEDNSLFTLIDSSVVLTGGDLRVKGASHFFAANSTFQVSRGNLSLQSTSRFRAEGGNVIVSSGTLGASSSSKVFLTSVEVCVLNSSSLTPQEESDLCLQLKKNIKETIASPSQGNTQCVFNPNGPFLSFETWLEIARNLDFPVSQDLGPMDGNEGIITQDTASINFNLSTAAIQGFVRLQNSSKIEGHQSDLFLFSGGSLILEGTSSLLLFDTTLQLIGGNLVLLDQTNLFLSSGKDLSIRSGNLLLLQSPPEGSPPKPLIIAGATLFISNGTMRIGNQQELEVRDHSKIQITGGLLLITEEARLRLTQSSSGCVAAGAMILSGSGESTIRKKSSISVLGGSVIVDSNHTLKVSQNSFLNVERGNLVLTLSAQMVVSADNSSLTLSGGKVILKEDSRLLVSSAGLYIRDGSFSGRDNSKTEITKGGLRITGGQLLLENFSNLTLDQGTQAQVSSDGGGLSARGSSHLKVLGGSKLIVAIPQGNSRGKAAVVMTSDSKLTITDSSSMMVRGSVAFFNSSSFVMTSSSSSSLPTGRKVRRATSFPLLQIIDSGAFVAADDSKISTTEGSIVLQGGDFLVKDTSTVTLKESSLTLFEGSVKLSDNSKMNLLRDSTLRIISEDGSLSVKDAAILRLDASQGFIQGGDLILEAGATLTLDSKSLLQVEDGKVKVHPEATVFISRDSKILNGKLVVGGGKYQFQDDSLLSVSDKGTMTLESDSSFSGKGSIENKGLWSVSGKREVLVDVPFRNKDRSEFRMDESIVSLSDFRQIGGESSTRMMGTRLVLVPDTNTKEAPAIVEAGLLTGHATISGGGALKVTKEGRISYENAPEERTLLEMEEGDLEVEEGGELEFEINEKEKDEGRGHTFIGIRKGGLKISNENEKDSKIRVCIRRTFEEGTRIELISYKRLQGKFGLVDFSCKDNNNKRRTKRDELAENQAESSACPGFEYTTTGFVVLFSPCAGGGSETYGTLFILTLCFLGSAFTLSILVILAILFIPGWEQAFKGFVAPTVNQAVAKLQKHNDTQTNLAKYRQQQ